VNVKITYCPDNWKMRGIILVQGKIIFVLVAILDMRLKITDGASPKV